MVTQGNLAGTPARLVVTAQVMVEQVIRRALHPADARNRQQPQRGRDAATAGKADAWRTEHGFPGQAA